MDGARTNPMLDRLLARLRYVQKNAKRTVVGPVKAAVGDMAYRTPQDLAVTPLTLRRALLIGSCMSSSWPKAIAGCTPACPVDFYLFNNMSRLPDDPPRPAEEYDFMIVQIPMRTVIPDNRYFQTAPGGHEELFAHAKERLKQALDETMRWNRNHGITTFVCNFLVPQQNPLGRLLPRYDLSNFVYFVESLNRCLVEELAAYENTHLLDIDQVTGTYGKKYFQDDVLFQSNHGSAFSNAGSEHDQNRLEPMVKPSELYSVRIHGTLQVLWMEVVGMYRTIRQMDSVKLVVFDLDDTLWRGIAAEKTERSGDDIEGWPSGIYDTIGYLRRRGVLLGILSKNDEGIIRKLWEQIVGKNKLKLEDFAVIKINWQPKAANLEAMLHEVNLLPKNVVFVDDNPVERESIKRAFPGIRTLGSYPYLWRRILLWSPETQVARITSESSARTEMVRAQVERENQRQQMSREDFLASLSLEMSLRELSGVKDPKATRALELINKTNQFNTTGKRWTEQEFAAAFKSGKRVYVFDVKDNFTAYGTVGVVVVHEGEVEQFVMSCRTAGLDVEIAAMAQITREMAARAHTALNAAFTETDLNLLCRDFYKRCGFESRDGRWQRPAEPPLEQPAHIKMVDKLS